MGSLSKQLFTFIWPAVHPPPPYLSIWLCDGIEQRASKPSRLTMSIVGQLVPNVYVTSPNSSVLQRIETPGQRCRVSEVLQASGLPHFCVLLVVHFEGRASQLQWCQTRLKNDWRSLEFICNLGVRRLLSIIQFLKHAAFCRIVAAFCKNKMTEFID